MQEHLFRPVLEIVLETMPRDNLLNSACLEFFEFIKRENIKVLIIHIVENYREELERIDYVDTFRELILKYEQNQNPAPSFVTVSTMTPTSEELNRRGQWQGNARELDAAEEEYFNTSDNEEEDESTNKSSSRIEAQPNGSSPATKPLVDYNSDEENDLSAGIVTPKSEKDENTKASSSDTEALPVLRVLTAAPPPPERLSEKRRREEDEEDEIGKLSNKRRSSISSNASTSSSQSSGIRRRKSFTPAREGSSPIHDSTKTSNGGSMKIAISLTPTSITTGREGNDSNGA